MLASLLLLALSGTVNAVLMRNVSNAEARATLQNPIEKPLVFAAAWSTPPCQCEANNQAWTRSNRATPKCILIDLGAADGNTFRHFLNNGYGEVNGCPSGQWEAYLVEANPRFDQDLRALEVQYPGRVHALPSTAAFTCKGQASFLIDADAEHNQWGSSMSRASNTGLAVQKKVTVPTINVCQLLFENVLTEDWVMLKVDIEGAEYDLVPCLSNFANVGLVDRMYLEEHWWFKVDSPTTPEQMAAAKAKLQSMHVDIPVYYSPSL